MLDKLLQSGDEGILSLARIREIAGYPGQENFDKGPVVVVECDEDIPCNPCEDICPRGAITVGNPITNLPKVDPERCDGCIICISICPGLCIFVVHKNYSEEESLIYLPYEMSPLPQRGSSVEGCNRCGEPVCEARVVNVIKAEKLKKTSILAVAVPKKYFEIVRAIR